MIKKCLYLMCVLGVFAAGCVEDECSSRDMAYCSKDGMSMMICKDGKWTPKSCIDRTCGYLDGAIQCIESSTAVCVAGARECTNNNIMKQCGPDNLWHYQTCGTDAYCLKGSCIPKPNPGGKTEPEPPVPQKTYSGIVKSQCSLDGKSIEYVDTEGGVLSKTCAEEVGFDTTCEVFGNGHVGCAVPDACSDVFSASGTCVGNHRLWCNDAYETPRPEVQDCSVLNEQCVNHAGQAKCYPSCDAADDKAFACTGNNVSRCIAVDGHNILQSEAAICESDKVSVSCANGAVVRTDCADNQICHGASGVCVDVCAEGNVDELKCSASGGVLQCKPIDGGFAYISRGQRHCLDNTLVSCVQNEETGEFSLKNTDCGAYEKEDGTVVAGKCVMDYQYYPDMDMCLGIPADAQSCGDLTDSGTCSGSVLKYCDLWYDIVVESDCSESSKLCSMYKGYADCRKTCEKAGYAECSYAEAYESYLLNLCVPDDVSGELSFVEGTEICFGDELYSCSSSGSAQVKNCALEGGRCVENRCVYPACSASLDPVCYADDAIEACLVGSDGNVLGRALSSKVCNPDGSCYVCESGVATRK
ncbi:MAG: hypothetical protein IJM59_08405 [Proteobacteria bacterium]|nr:hypothetical protein [Pseudomonadota bacterium]